MNKLPLLELCTGIGGFHLAAQQNGLIETICTAEIDPYNTKLIDRNFNLDNCGDVSEIGLPRACHSHQALIDEDKVPVEETGFTSLCMEDFMEGILPWPVILSAGFPCQDVTPANTLGNHVGIKGKRSGLVDDILWIAEDLEVPYIVLENSSNLINRGLDVILSKLHDLGYVVEWEIIAATAFGFPHYRHRTYIVAYLPTTAVARGNRRIFDTVRKQANKQPNHFMPLPSEDPEYILNAAVVKEPRSIKLRTKRINGVGNAIVPAIAKAIFDAITDAEFAPVKPKQPKSRKNETYMASKLAAGWGVSQLDIFSMDNQELVTNMPSRGILIGGNIYTGEPDRNLNPTKTTFPNLLSTCIAKDGNNNFTSGSRMSRPGKLGGLIGDIQRLGATEGGLNPVFAERMLGYPDNHTRLAY